jgi:SAM-dependent methyltransferase
MSEVFGSAYANVYDALYRDKNYSAECDMIEGILKQYGKSPVRSILDLGCGTGNHAIIFAERDYEVVGVDCSQEMINSAKTKAESKNLRCNFRLADIRQLDLNRKFDAVVMMFAVLGYQLENADVLAALKSARKHLNSGGLLIFDVWYGPAVLAQRPTDRIKVILTSNNNRILRAASGDLDICHHICTVHYHLWQLNGNTLAAETEEEHRMRFFFSQELGLFTQIAGFRLERLGSFPDFENDPSENTWNVISTCTAE